MDRERPFRVRQRAVVRSTNSGNSYKPAHLIGLGEVALRWWPGFADRLDRAGDGKTRVAGEFGISRQTLYQYLRTED